MKAALLHLYGEMPVYADVPAPVAGEGQELVTVRASAIKQLDLLKASGKHYTKYPSLPAVVGVDGVGLLPDGRRVWAMGITGMMADKALVQQGRYVPVPDGLDDAVAAALPNALIGSDAALLHRARLQQGEVVLVNGGTGSTGMMAVQAAKHRGAKKVVATGRNAAALERLKQLGADETISLSVSDEDIIAQLQASYAAAPFDIVIDYLWGKPMQLLLESVKSAPMKRMRIVTVGEMAGKDIGLASATLRSKPIELLGSGIGSISAEELAGYFRNEMPAMLALAADGKLQLDIERVPLKDISAAWQAAAGSSKRLVMMME